MARHLHDRPDWAAYDLVQKIECDWVTLIGIMVGLRHRTSVPIDGTRDHDSALASPAERVPQLNPYVEEPSNPARISRGTDQLVHGQTPVQPQQRGDLIDPHQDGPADHADQHTDQQNEPADIETGGWLCESIIALGGMLFTTWTLGYLWWHFGQLLDGEFDNDAAGIVENEPWYFAWVRTATYLAPPRTTPWNCQYMHGLKVNLLQSIPSMTVHALCVAFVVRTVHGDLPSPGKAPSGGSTVPHGLP